MQLREAFLFVRRQSILRRGYGRALVNGCAERRYDACNNVVDNCADAETVEFDDVADDEGGVGIVD